MNKTDLMKAATAVPATPEQMVNPAKMFFLGISATADIAIAEIERLQARYLQAINLMGAAAFDRGQSAQMLADMVDFFGDVTMGQIGVEKFEMGSKLIKQAKKVIKKADAELEYNVEFERIQIAAKRYETLRTLNVPQFRDLYIKSLEGGVAFDELVDSIGKEGQAL